ncbi:hypothetical protein WA026_006175 [Henosepilachna vigintioctopunctata]|uniref:Uncharacterized protein n=1 Tax=Henosepilachna vigintioctopunctata TaxID=420089 RepID=A0AAW1TPI1_9CUCU
MAEEFIERFHNLEGTLLKEKKKSLFFLLDSYKSLHNEEHTLTKISQNLKPRTCLEEIYKLEFLIYFRRSCELFEELKSGNDLAASKIIRHPWFIEYLFNDKQCEEFVQNVFPLLSIVVRSKILKQIRKLQNEESVNALFDCLLERYGLQPAMILLCGCSTDKIRQFLKRGLKLSNTRLKLLHDKSPSLINFYYEEYHRRGGDLEPSFIKYLSFNDANLYVQLRLKYNIDSGRLGRRTTTKYVLENREAIMLDRDKYLSLNIFHVKALNKVLRSDLRLSQKRIVPDEEHIHCTLSEGGNTKVSSANSDGPLDIIEAVEDIDQLDGSSLVLMDLKKMIDKCDDIEECVYLFEDFVENCSKIKDYNALLDFLSLFCRRFRNTDAQVSYIPLDQIYRRIKLNDLTDEHWVCIHEIILIQDLRGLPIYNPIVLEYSKYLYKNGRDFGEMVPIYLKSQNFSLRNVNFKDETFKDIEFQREFLKLALEQYNDNLHQATEIILAIRDWNKRHPYDIILVSEKEEIVDRIKKSVDVNWLHQRGDEFLSMKYLVCRENMSEEFTDIYFNHMNSLENVTMTKWFLKYKPDVFQKYAHDVSECKTIMSNHSLLKLSRKYEHIDLLQTLIKYNLEKLIDSKTLLKDKIADILASIMPKQDYLELLKKNIPKCDKLDLKTASLEEKNIHKIQVALAKSVRYSTCKVEALPILLKYCRGDYFQPALISLYSCLYRIPEKSLENVSAVLLKKAVSVRKHTIFLSVLVFPAKTVETLVLHILETENNDSIKKHLFTRMSKDFLKKPCDVIWKMLQTYMDHLTVHETETLTAMADVHVIPETYKRAFIDKVCNIYGALEKKENTPMNIYYDILMKSVMDDDIKFLSADWCMDIIRRNFTKEEDADGSWVSFTIKFLMYGDKMRENIRYILNMMEAYKKKYWNTSSRQIAMCYIHNIFKQIYNKTMNIEEFRLPLLKEFPSILAEEWKKVFSIDETLEEYLMLDFMILKYQENHDEQFYAREIIKIFASLRKKYGDLITTLFKEFLSAELILLLGTHNYMAKLLELLVNILKLDSSLPITLIVIQLLPGPVSHYNEIIRNVSDENIVKQAYLNRR